MLLSKDEAADLVKGELEGYLQGMGINTKKNFRCINPAHTDDTHPSMGYDAKRRRVHCFSCNCSYDMFDLLSLEYGWKEKELFRNAYEMFHLEVEGYQIQDSQGRQGNRNPSFYLSRKEARLIGVYLPVQISVPKMEEESLSYQKVRCGWHDFLSEDEIKSLVRTKSKEKLRIMDQKRAPRHVVVEDTYRQLLKDYPHFPKDKLKEIAEQSCTFPQEEYDHITRILKRAQA